MVIHCPSCQKLFYLDFAVAEQPCPACASSATSITPMILFGSASNDHIPVNTPLQDVHAGAA
jgi:hypothetical protein